MTSSSSSAPPDAWARNRVLAFDLETTGPDPREARIVTFALLLVAPDGTIALENVGLVNPGAPIPKEATAVHGVTAERAIENGIPTTEALEHICAGLAAAALDNAPICAFNAFYDLTVVREEAKRHLDPKRAQEVEELLAGAQVIDSLVLDKQTAKYRKGSRKLSAVAEHRKVAPGDWHTAEADALAAALIAYAIAEEHPEIGAMTAAEIHAAQKRWAKEQADGLRDYFRKAKKPEAAASVSSAWPYLGALM